MTIYIDSDYNCHVSAAEGRRAVETDAFNGKVYLCTRDSGQPLAFDLAELVGLYVTEVTE